MSLKLKEVSFLEKRACEKMIIGVDDNVPSLEREAITKI
jgi:hypothetical protein